MKRVLKAAVRSALTLLARFAVMLHNPVVIAVTGSVGKTTTKDMITAVLREDGRSVRGSRKRL